MFPIAVPLAPHLLHILRFLFTLFLLLGLPELVRRVSKLLNPVIDLAQFGLGRVIGRNNLCYWLLHRRPLPREAFELSMPILAEFLPETLLALRRETLFINK